MAIVVFDGGFVGRDEEAFHELSHEGSFANPSAAHDDDSVGLPDLHAANETEDVMRLTP